MEQQSAIRTAALEAADVYAKRITEHANNAAAAFKEPFDRLSLALQTLSEQLNAVCCPICGTIHDESEE